MTDVGIATPPAAPQSRCGACGQTDDHPKHQIFVGIGNQHTTNGQEVVLAPGVTVRYHEHDHDRDGVIHYHFDCESEWHDLHSALATEPLDSPDPEQPWLAWLEDSAAEQRAIADRHAEIIAQAKAGTKGTDLRSWIQSHNAGAGGIRGGAGGIDQTRANKALDGYAPNSGTTTMGADTITGPLHMRLMTANGSDTAAGTELATSGGYTAGGSALAFAAAATGSKATNAGVSWTNMPSTTLTGMEEWDTSATPLRIMWAPWSAGNIVVGAGNTFTVASGNLTNSLA